MKYRTLAQYCAENGTEALLSQWDSEANGTLTPDDVSPNSKAMVYWRCEKGHQWQTPVKVRSSGSGCPYCTGKLVLPGYNDLKSSYPRLAQEWDTEKNGALTPEQVTPNSHKKVWWRCEKGHSWSAMIQARRRGNGCPFCAGRLITPEGSNLATEYPEIATQWHRKKNGRLTPQELSSACNDRAWWICEKGHEWRASVASRTKNGCGCPYCTGKKLLTGFNDLQTCYPDIAAQWDEGRNGVPASAVLPGKKAAWWICEKGHSWQAIINVRTLTGTGCPVCANKVIIAGENDLTTDYPHIAAQWHPEKNGELKATEVSIRSNRKVWWRCSEGHEYQAVVSDRTCKGSGCPYCGGKKVLAGFNDLATVEPKIAAQWHPTLNGSLTPEMVTAGSSRMVWWQCSDGHEWQAPVARRTIQLSGCPYCSGRVGTKRLELYRRIAAERRASIEADPELESIKEVDISWVGLSQPVLYNTLRSKD